MEIISVRDLGSTFRFLITHKDDHIQKTLLSGRFYEAEELELIASYTEHPRGILDVGANVGSHSIYFAHRFQPEVLIPVEPNPAITDVLKANLGLNWHPSMDLSLVGSGLSNRAGHGHAAVASERNLGGARLVPDAGGIIPVHRGDDVLGGRPFDLIKIDVEGMELEVIEGLAATLMRSRATVFVEVLFANIDPTIEAMRKHGYGYTDSYQRYGRCINLLFQKEG